MLKILSSRIIISTLALGIVYPLFKPYPVEAISFSFYQGGFGDNGFLKGTFSGSDNDNDGYISFDVCTYFLGYKCDYVFSNYDEFEEVYEKTDRGHVDLDYFSDHSVRISLSTGDLGSFFWEYSISSNQLRGYTEKLYSGVYVSQKETCVGGNWINLEYYDDYKELCSSSPLVIVSQGLPSKDNSGDDSSTKVPEPSLSLSLQAVGTLSAGLSAGSALLRRQKQ